MDGRTHLHPYSLVFSGHKSPRTVPAQARLSREEGRRLRAGLHPFLPRDQGQLSEWRGFPGEIRTSRNDSVGQKRGEAGKW